MTRQILPPEIAQEDERVLSVEEFRRRLAIAEAELQGEEGENLRSLMDWFQRRYPTPKARLAYARRKYAEWTRNSPKSAVR